MQKSGILIRLTELYSWWCSLVLSGYIGHIVIYIPSDTMSGIGADGKYSNNMKNKGKEVEIGLQITVRFIDRFVLASGFPPFF